MTQKEHFPSRRMASSLWDSVCVLEMEIEHLTGKKAKELLKRRDGQ